MPLNSSPSTIPGALIAIAGVGVLLTGDSGTGKSDTILGLLDRGHRLIADDAVELYRHGNQLHGRCPPPLRGLVAIRGLGVLCVPELFGPEALLDSQRLDLEIALRKSPPPVDPLMVVRGNRSIMGVTVPCLQLPATGRRDLPLLLEIAVRMRANSSAQTSQAWAPAQHPGGKESR